MSPKKKDARVIPITIAILIALLWLPGILPNPEDNSCLPKAARAAGMGYDELIQSCLLAAARRAARLEEGVSTEADVRREFGAPFSIEDQPDGSRSVSLTSGVPLVVGALLHEVTHEQGGRSAHQQVAVPSAEPAGEVPGVLRIHRPQLAHPLVHRLLAVEAEVVLLALALQPALVALGVVPELPDEQQWQGHTTHDVLRTGRFRAAA